MAASKLFKQPALRRFLMVGLACLALSFLPLVGALGYENALVLGPVFSLCGLGIGIDAYRKHGSLGVTVSARKAIFELLGLAGLGWLQMAVARIWHPACDLLGGSLFYAVGPWVSGLCGLVLGLVSAFVAARRGRALLVGIAVIAVSTGISLYRLYAHPVIYAFDPFWGYFSGAIYDEGVGITARYLHFRLYNVAACLAALLVLASLRDKTGTRFRWPTWSADRYAFVPGVVLSVLSVTVFARADRLGFTATSESLAEILPLHRQTEHFDIYYPSEGPIARTIDLVAREHEFAYARLLAMTGHAPEGRVASFMFASSSQKREAMGAGKVQVAAPWRRQIYLDARDFPHEVLHHELAHIFGGPIGDDLFGVSRKGMRISSGMVEGYATALAPRSSDKLDLHDQARVIDALERRPPLRDLLGGALYKYSSSLAYTLTGSFCLWLMEAHGYAKLSALYTEAGDADRAFGHAVEDFEEEWVAFLRTRSGPTQGEISAAEERFKRRSIFERPCAHAVVAQADRVRRSLAHNDFEDAVAAQQELCEMESFDAGHLLGLARVLGVAERFVDGQNAAMRAAEFPEASATMQRNAFEMVGDLALVNDDLIGAEVAYAQAAAFPASSGEERMLTLKRLATQNPVLAERMRRYHGAFDMHAEGSVQMQRRMAVAAELAEQLGELPALGGLGDYLLGIQLMGAQEFALALPRLERARARAGLPAPAFDRALREQLLAALVATGNYSRAKEILAEVRALPETRNGHLATYALWEERIAWFEQGN